MYVFTVSHFKYVQDKYGETLEMTIRTRSETIYNYRHLQTLTKSRVTQPGKITSLCSFPKQLFCACLTLPRAWALNCFGAKNFVVTVPCVAREEHNEQQKLESYTLIDIIIHKLLLSLCCSC